MYSETLLHAHKETFLHAIYAAYPSVFSDGDIETITGIKGGVQNYNYRITHKNGENYFLSVLRPEKGLPLTDDRLDGVTKAVDHVVQKGVLFPAPQKGKSGVFYETMPMLDGVLPAVDGAPFCILSSWLPGVSVDVLDTETAHAYGRLLGKFANAGKDFEHAAMGSPLTPDNVMALCTGFMDEKASGLKQKAKNTDIQPAKQILSRFAERLEKDGLASDINALVTTTQSVLERYSDLPRTLAHKDLHKGNIIKTEQGLAMLDPDWFGPQEIAVYDLAMTLAFETLEPVNDGYAFNASHFIQILGGYMQERPLSPKEKEALPAFMDVACLRFFTRRLMTLQLEPENIQKAPDEFIDRAKVIPDAKQLEKIIKIAGHYAAFQKKPAYADIKINSPEHIQRINKTLGEIGEALANGLEPGSLAIQAMKQELSSDSHIIRLAQSQLNAFANDISRIAYSTKEPLAARL